MLRKPSAEPWRPEFWRLHPGFASIAEPAQRLCSWQQWPEPASYYSQLSADGAVEFINAEVLAYEDHIAETGQVPTRYACWHDLLNALVWHCYPQAKLALNRLHRAAKLHSSESGQRGRRRDAATLFDENGAVVWSDDPNLLKLIRDMDWPTLFLQHRAAFGRTLHVRLFGHGLLEKLQTPFLGLTAHALLLPSAATADGLDAVLAEHIDSLANHWTPATLAPLPILGIPGWWPDNEQPAFYQNRDYFRRERSRQQKS
ncbi:DUF3025 domain-containing protein [Permianibacter sp. IMCC34836]|uniref:DUF3025 domain-containing protein n=1 Tax=Permianibacter fluminis TaxID=2738515 RepID=UPI00155530CE|nr:DUF3025 domain-containing protein [Permianibacter fluminis]NQD37678.1 DUF3025 domain-containing protein [Permianibacter fluminis]